MNEVIDGTSPDVRSLLVWHQGRLVLEEYFYGFDRDRLHGMRSFSKSVISLLVGAAIDRKLLRADEPALARLGLPTLKNPDPRKSRITVSQLLSNQSGLACNEHDRESPGSEVKLGILIRDRGLWQGKRVIFASWIDAAVSRRSRVADSDYGLGIWHRWYEVATANGPRRVDTVMLSGNGGQEVYLVPSLDLIVVSTGTDGVALPSPEGRKRQRITWPALRFPLRPGLPRRCGSPGCGR